MTLMMNIKKKLRMRMEFLCLFRVDEFDNEYKLGVLREMKGKRDYVKTNGRQKIING